MSVRFRDLHRCFTTVPDIVDDDHGGAAGAGGGGGRGARGGSGTDDEDDEEDEHVDLRRVDAARGMIGGVHGGVNGDGRVDGIDGHAHMGVGGGAGKTTSPGGDGRGRGSPTERGNRRGKEGEHTWTRDAMHEQNIRETAREAYEAAGAEAVAAAAAAAAAKRRKRGKASCCSWLRGEMCVLYTFLCLIIYQLTNAVQPPVVSNSFSGVPSV